MDKYTQHQAILQYLNQHGSITMMNGFHELGITKINTRCGELIKLGHPINKQVEKKDGKRYMRYTLGTKPFQMALF